MPPVLLSSLSVTKMGILYLISESDLKNIQVIFRVTGNMAVRCDLLLPGFSILDLEDLSMD